jgi:Predicted transcriptional regulator
MRGSGRRYLIPTHTQAREAIAPIPQNNPKYDFNRSANVLRTVKHVPNATVDELATKLRAKRGTIYATLRNLERKNLVTRTRAPCGPTTRPPDLWQAK